MHTAIVELKGPSQRAYAKRQIDEAPDGAVMRIGEKKRSDDQSNLMWSALGDIAKQVMWPVNGKQELLTAEDWKNIITASLEQESRMAVGLRGGFIILGKRTSTMSMRRMSELISLIHSFGDEKGVQWSVTSLGREAVPA